jgi:hypothetical protein
MPGTDGHDLADISPTAWRLLRVGAGFGQRDVEREIPDLRQAHVSMLEGGTRGLSASRREALFDLYATNLTDEQVDVLIRNF